MKKVAHSLALLFLILLLVNTSHILARLLESRQGEDAYLARREENDSLASVIQLQQLMGLEDCHTSGDDDEECAERRMAAEAHLDYIYTQHLKP